MKRGVCDIHKSSDPKKGRGSELRMERPKEKKESDCGAALASGRK